MRDETSEASEVETASGRYRVETVRFRYQFGEVQLAARDVPVAVDTSLFFDRAPDAGAFVPPPEVLKLGVPCVMVLSQPLVNPLPLVASTGPYVRFVPHQYRRSTVRLEGPFSDYLASMPADRRRKLLTKQRKYRDACGGELRVHVSRTAMELEHFHRLARPIATATYQERLFGKGLPGTRAFLDDMRRRGTRGTARGYLLAGPGHSVAAYIYVVINGPLVTFEHLGYDASLSKLSPGLVLQMAALDDLFDACAGKVFDFGEGDGQHKSTFGTELTPCADLYFFPKTLRGLELFAGQALAHGVSRTAVQTLTRTGLRDQVKRFVRRTFGARG